MKWSDLKMYDSDDCEFSVGCNQRTFAKGLAEWVLGGSILGLFFAEGYGSHEAKDDPSTFGPAAPEVLDWSGFLKWAKVFLDKDDIEACRRRIQGWRPIRVWLESIEAVGMPAIRRSNINSAEMILRGKLTVAIEQGDIERIRKIWEKYRNLDEWADTHEGWGALENA